MPPAHGESVLLTLFADVHYIFSPPGHRPPHIRFEKGSYVYLYQNPSTGQGRVEIANNAGTSHQDAFDGSLEYAHLRHTQKQPCLFAIDILRHPHVSQRQWQLKAFDQRHEREYMYPIQSIDIYFYAPDDARDFAGGLKRVHMVGGMDIEEATSPSHRDSGAAMSPVVQQLEHVAISSPNPAATTQRSPSAGIGQQYPGPPSTATHTQTSTPQSNFMPAAYNPAAPAAPEPIAHREKTPPPPDADNGTGLSNAATQDQVAWASQVSYPRQSNAAVYPQQVPQPGQHQHTSFSPPPPPQTHMQFAPPPQMSSPPPPGPASPGLPNQQGAKKVLPFQQYQQSFPGPPQPGQPGPQQQQQQYAQYQPQYSSPLQSPSHLGSFSQPLQSPGFAPPPTQASPQQNENPPLGGYSTYAYTQGQQGASQQASEAHNIHAQVYRPTEAEANRKMPAGQAAKAGPGQAPGKFEARAAGLEKGVNKWLKKLDKHL